MQDLTHTYFEQFLNQPFHIHYGGETPIEVILASVSTLGQAPELGEDRRHSFALLFQSEMKEQYLIQQIYAVAHADIGTLDLFLVPIGSNETGMQYEAVFT